MFPAFLQTLPIAKVFWTLIAIEVIGCGVLAILASRGRRTPEGPVGGWLVLVPPVFWIALAVLFCSTKSPSTRTTLTFIVSIPLLAVTFGPLLDKVRRAKWERDWRGAGYFRWPAQRRLAGAIYDHDLELVKQLIAGAGDLNKRYSDGETLFRFAMRNADASDASTQIVDAMLRAGANPNDPVGDPLKFAILSSPKLTEMLLKHSADPNAIDRWRPPCLVADPVEHERRWHRDAEDAARSRREYPNTRQRVRPRGVGGPPQELACSAAAHRAWRRLATRGGLRISGEPARGVPGVGA